MDSKQLKEYIIEPTLIAMGLHSTSAVNLLLGTIAQESKMGEYIHQLGGGPALGIYQMEPNTERDIHENYLKYNPLLTSRLEELSLGGTKKEAIGNLYYATAMARLHYRRVKESLPHHDDVEGLASYWKRFYNTRLGKGTEEEFIANYKRYVLNDGT